MTPMRELRTQRLRLEPQLAAHAAAMFEVLSDPAIYAHENAPPASVEWLQERYRKLETRHSADASEQWLNWVLRGAAGELLGYVQATVETDGQAFIAYELASADWGRGLAAEAVTAMVGELHAHYGVHTLLAVFKRSNLRSRRLLERLGFGAAAGDDARRATLGADEDLMLRAAAATPGSMMKTVTFWFDPISPFAYLAFEQLPQALEGCSYAVDYRPVLFAGLLAHWGQKGPAEIEPKRAWTFRHVAWLAHQQGCALDAPAVHPFNPLPLLRLAIACGPNRRVVEALMRHVWVGGGDAADADGLAVLAQALAPGRDPDAAEVKAELRRATESAIALGIFGVPTFALDGRLFWGIDALPMLRAALLGDPWFAGPDWHQAGLPRPGVKR